MKRNLCMMTMVLGLLAAFFSAGWSAPGFVNYQGRLTDAAGTPLNDTLSMTFSLYDVAVGGTYLWLETHPNVAVENGVYNVTLGAMSALDAGLFSVDDLWLEVACGGEVMSPRQRITSTPFALQSTRAASAEDADFLEGKSADQLDQSDHVLDTGNPHMVTAAQTGAMTLAEHTWQNLSGIPPDIADGDDVGAGITAVTAGAGLTGGGDTGNVTLAASFAGTGSAATVARSDHNHSSTYASVTHDHDTRYYTQAQVDSMVAAMQAQIDALKALLNGVTRSGSDITFKGVNVRINNGTGTTSGTVNGLGNLIVGYNELRGFDDDRSGSHNVIIGKFHNYTNSGGLVAGLHNTISGNYASVSGGHGNEASGNYASVSGGLSNVAGEWYASVSGGHRNVASGNYASVSGGFDNEASGTYASVSGGYGNVASEYSASVSGGNYNHATGNSASVSGGRNNTAQGNFSFIGGGGSDSPTYGNKAYAPYSAILGGKYNETGVSTNSTEGWHATISGGDTNKATGGASSISGGVANKAIEWRSAVSGGAFMTADEENEWCAAGTCR